jgi:predicted  nucleic acid-binding Zn-ribbon protein
MCRLLKELRKARRKSNRKLLKLILSKLEVVMASIDEVRAEIAEVKQNLTDQADALSTIVAKIAALEAVIAGGLTAEQADEVLAEVRAIKEGTQAVEDSMRAAGTTA